MAWVRSDNEIFNTRRIVRLEVKPTSPGGVLVVTAHLSDGNPVEVRGPGADWLLKRFEAKGVRDLTPPGAP